MRRNLFAIPLVAVLLSLPGSAQPRPVELTRLSEEQQWATVEKAAPGDVFTVRGRRVTARDLKRQMAASRAAAEERRRRLEAKAQPWKSDRLETLRRLAELERRAAEEAQRPFVEQTLREIGVGGPDTPEIRRLRTEAVRLAGQWMRAAPEERRTIEARLKQVEDQLRRLGAPLQP